VSLHIVPLQFQMYVSLAAKRRISLKLATSTEYAAVPLPSCNPDVSTTRRVALAACPIMHRTEVSDSHSVLSHPVCLVRDKTVKANNPNPTP
jgi:hypothetical protein